MATLCIAGKNQIAIDVANFVLKNFSNWRLIACVNSTDTFENTWQKSFGLFCKENSILVVDQTELYEIEDLVFVSLEYDKLIAPQKFKSSQLYNIHFSLLPEYKGMYTSYFPILEGRDYSGVSLHKIDHGIDTGDIIEQTKFDIEISDTTKDLYLKYLKHGADLVISKLDDLLSNSVVAYPQSPIKSTYYSKKLIDFKNTSLNFRNSAWQVYNQVRALSFREYQMPRYNGCEYYRSEILDERSNLKPGTIIFEDKFKTIFATVDYNICLFKDQLDILLKHCKEGNFESVKEIIEMGYPYKVKNSMGWNAAIVSSYFNKQDIVKLLLDFGVNINETNYKGTTLLMYAMTAACKDNDISTMSYLIKRGADLSLKDFRGKSFFDYAKEYDNPVVKQFINTTL